MIHTGLIDTSNLSEIQRQRAWLEQLYIKYHKPEYIDSDPLMFVKGYQSPRDREVSALIVSSLAYGNVKAMKPAIADVLGRMTPTPYSYLMQRDSAGIHEDFKGFRYRVTDEERLCGLLIGLSGVLREYGSLEACFLQHDQADEADVLAGIEGMVLEIESASDQDYLHHVLSKPSKGSACKRLMLFMKWMVRQDEIDPGGWNLDPARLIMPIDTHVFQMSIGLGWVKRKTVNLKAALEITEILHVINPDDPLKYDFAMTRPGILSEDYIPWKVIIL